MATSVFENLSQIKKDHILSAIEVEILENKIENIKATNICKEAGIPRSAFYRYFEDVNDAVKTYFKHKKEESKGFHEQFLKDANQNIFAAAINMYNEMVDRATFIDKIAEMKRLGKEINLPDMSKNGKDEMIDQLQEHKEVMDLIGSIAMLACGKVIHGDMSKEESKILFKKYVLVCEAGYKKIGG